uniref:Uncharacterized protein n=1 Tax=Oryza brachyantha TaxID=4533 RepID=J3LTF3_ORYBR
GHGDPGQTTTSDRQHAEGKTTDAGDLPCVVATVGIRPAVSAAPARRSSAGNTVTWAHMGLVSPCVWKKIRPNLVRVLWAHLSDVALWKFLTRIFSVFSSEKKRENIFSFSVILIAIIHISPEQGVKYNTLDTQDCIAIQIRV